ncbi:MAG: hypothetical protein ACPLPR_10145 [Bacillota bacterium]
MSSAKQPRAGNLERQRQRLEEHSRSKGYEIVAVIAEQGSGLNEKRIERYLNAFGVKKTEVVHGEEPVQDTLSILTLFSAKLYGPRSRESRRMVRGTHGRCAKR